MNQLIEPEFLTLQQTGHFIGGLTPNAIRHMIRAKKLPYYQSGRRLMVRVEDIRKYMESCRVDVTKLTDNNCS